MDTLGALDPYAVLGVTPRASAEEVRRAYHARARRVHPDVDPAGVEAFRRLTAAYEILGDPRRRRSYDAARRAEETIRSGPTAERYAPVPTAAAPRVDHPDPTPQQEAAMRSVARPVWTIDEWALFAWLGRSLVVALVVGVLLLGIIGLAGIFHAVPDVGPVVPSPVPGVKGICQTPDGWVDCRALDPTLP
jgi:DnaJ domain